MLRLGTLDHAQTIPGGAMALAPSILSQALGNLVSERQIEGGAAVEQLCAALVSGAPGQALAYVDRLLACGVAVDSLYDTFFPRAAARLGELWVDDQLSFTAVTLGMARLTEAFRTMSPTFMRQRRPIRRDRRALFALVPGDQHALGVALAADYFQRAGWAVQVELQADAATLVRLAGRQPFHLIGLSAGSRRMVPALEALVAGLRSAAARDTTFLLGGALTALDPGIAARLGMADARCVRDALDGVEAAPA
jgi:methanogenic corrinoid protein MtbC1